MQPTSKQVRNIAVIVLILIIAGTATFSLAEHVSVVEGLYRTVYVLLAHHDNFHSTSAASRIAVILLIFSSLVIIAYLLKWLAEYMIGLGDGLHRRQMKARVSKMKEHYIVCGLGRVGRQVAKELQNEGVHFVGLDRDPDKVKLAVERSYTALVGDSTQEEVLKAAGIAHARGIVVCLGEDSANLFVTLAARQMHPQIFIVARANHTENRIRLERAGADRVVLPHQIGGFHMASMMLRPNMVDFLNVLSNGGNNNLQIAEFVVPHNSPLAGENIQWLNDHHIDATVLAINNVAGESRVNPAARENVAAGDRLILMGTPEQLQQASSRI